MELQNSSVCAKCGGECCKSCGCEFSVDDFATVNFQELQNYLDQGLISIDGDVGFDQDENLIYFLYVRMRNVGKDAVDFFAVFPSPCNALKWDGCPFSFENRPSGGKFLVPVEDGNCYPLKDVTASWAIYQDLLEQLVISNTGLTPEEKIRERIEDIFYHFLQTDETCNSYWYYAYFFKKLPVSHFAAEFYRAKERCQNDQKLNRKNPSLSR